MKHRNETTISPQPIENLPPFKLIQIIQNKGILAIFQRTSTDFDCIAGFAEKFRLFAITHT